MTYSSSAFGAPLRHLDDVLRGIRTGRASPGLLEHVEVDAYGGRLRLKELARISAPDPRTLHVEPWDKSQLPLIEKAIATSSLGVNPVTSGAVVRVPLPPLTEDRRRELAKLVRQHIEDARIGVRQIREKMLKDLRAKKEEGTLSEDAFERERKNLQTDVDAAIAAADASGREKESEVLSG